MAVQSECPPLRIATHAMTSDKRTLAEHSYVGHATDGVYVTSKATYIGLRQSRIVCAKSRRFFE
jgi:hypothetical protein